MRRINLPTRFGFLSSSTMLINPLAVFLICVVLVGGQSVLVRRLPPKGVTSTMPPTPNSEDESVTCVCDGGCEHVRGLDCPFGLTFDVCRCCLVCARGEGEPCGGAVGNCAVGLHCKPEDDNVPSMRTNATDAEGRCSRDEGGCGGHVEVRFGCVISREGDCICSSRAGCPGETMFVFETEEECQDRMTYLIAKKDLEVEPRDTSATDDDCAKVQCPPVSPPCPADSYRLPSLVDHHHLQHHAHPEGTQEDGLSAEKRCCPEQSLEKCQCIPGLHCSAPYCPPGSGPKLVQNSTREPGRCCPKFQCTPSPVEVDEFHQGCKYNRRDYSSGETWSNREDCSECFCHNGVISCKPIKCDVPPGCPLARTPPNSCCPVCVVGCTTASGGVYNNSDSWEEDPCTSCTCKEGRVQCHAAMCHSTCDNPVHVPGECCPRCDLVNGGGDKDNSCPFLDCHRLDCPNGFSLDRMGCPTCKCSLSKLQPTSGCTDMAGCDLHCPFGFWVNEQQCSVCKCRQDLTTTEQGQGAGGEDEGDRRGTSSEKNLLLSPEKKQCHVSDGLPRFEGEEWTDKCRRCICKNGVEMCTLITCQPPNCEHPIFFSGDCCPRCPDEQVGHVNFSISVCQSSDGTERLEGESWGLGCLHCTCHHGQVLCAAPDCPPTPCPLPTLTTPPTKCCPSCPHQNTVTTNSSLNSNCLSDDSLKSYGHGETWKVGACQSCVCSDGGSIQCFSVAKCPPLECDRPVLAKNQCCPICLDDLRRLSSEEGTSPELHSRGMEPYCAVLIGMVLGLSLVLGVVLFRQCVCRRACSSSRLIKIKKAPPSFHSSNSSQDTPPVTPDCCYKCDYNKYSSCAQLSEQKPLFNPSSSSSSSSAGGGNNSDKV